MSTPLRIVGMPGSPYSRKLRAVMRYRRIPHAWMLSGSPESRTLPRPRVELMPQLIVAGENGVREARIDSTPLIRWLETAYTGRAVVPPDPALAFLDALLEDYADEWLTKAMFHYRWAFEDDIAHAATILSRWFLIDQPDAAARAAGTQFAQRQVGRRGVVGSNPTTAPLIEQSYERLLTVLDARLTGSRFVMGGRPGAADFGLYGQLTQLTGFDPTSRAVALRVAPRIVAWTDVVEDLSGLEPSDDDWVTRAQARAALHPLFAEVGRVYVPFLLANAAAISRGAVSVECLIDGRSWVQTPFPYQAKCLRWLREAHAALTPDARDAVGAVLAGTGCEALFDA